MRPHCDKARAIKNEVHSSSLSQVRIFFTESEKNKTPLADQCSCSNSHWQHLFQTLYSPEGSEPGFGLQGPKI